MKKRVLALLLTLCMVFALLPATALAAEGNVEVVVTAADGTEKYAGTLQGSKWKVKDGDTLTLCADLTVDELTLGESNSSATLDLNGHTLTGQLVVYNQRTTIVKDSTATAAPTINDDHTVTYQSGKIVNDVPAVSVQSGSTFILESGTIESQKGSGVSVVAGATANINGGYVCSKEFGVLVEQLGSTANINGGVIEAMDNAAVAGNGGKDNGNTIININGGNLISHIKTPGYIACGVYHPQNGQLNITGGDIYADGGVGVLMRAGQLNMTGGTVTATGTTSGYVGDQKVAIASNGIVLDYQSNYPGNAGNTMSAEISGSAAISTDPAAKALEVMKTDAQTPAKTIVVTGGTFSSDPSAFVQEGLVANHGENGDFTIGVNPDAVAMINGKPYMTLEAAVQAANAGDTIQLQKNVATSECPTVTKALTLDLNGKTFTGSNKNSAILVNGADGHLTVTDTSAEAAGKIVGTASNAIWVYGGGKVTLNAGTLEAGSKKDPALYLSTNGKAEINGGKIVGLDYGLAAMGNTVVTVNGGDITANGHALLGNGNQADGSNITINGGTIHGKEMGIYHPQDGTLTINGGTIIGDATGIELRAGTAVVNGGTITGNGVPTETDPNGNGPTTTGAGIAVVQHTTKKTTSLTVKGGTVSGYTPIWEKNSEGNAPEDLEKVSIALEGGKFVPVNGGKNPVYSENKTNFITGGSFANAPATEYVAEDLAAVPNGSGEFIIVEETKAQISSVTVTPNTAELYLDQETEKTVKLTAKVTNETNDAIQDVTWSVTEDGKDIVSVDENGVVTALAPGYAVVRATSKVDSTKYGECKVSVKTYVAPQPPVQTVVVSTNGHGTVTVYPTNPVAGQTVTLTVNPHQSYALKELRVTDANGNRVEVKALANGDFTFVMPYGKVYVNALFAEKEIQMPFDDVRPDSFYYDAVLWAMQNHITSGVTATMFAPEQVCNRAEAVTFLWRAAGSPRPYSYDNPFTDVASDAYYYEAVLWAVEQGITKGTSATTFAPAQTCSRGEIVTFLWRANGSPLERVSNPFTDVAADDYFADAVLWAVERGITNGMTATTFAPGATCTRGQIVTFLYRAAK